MKRRAGLILTLFIFSTSQLLAQKQERFTPEWSLRTNPLSLLESDGGIMLGINYRWSQKFSASFEPGWIFCSLIMRDDHGNIIQPSGIKIRADFRIHFSRRRNSTETFLAPEIHYKNTRVHRPQTFGIGCENGNCTYYQESYYKEIKNEYGGALKAGVLTPVSRNERWLMEFYCGVGVKYMTFKVADIPIGGSFTDPPQRLFPDIQIGGTNSDNFYYPMMPIGLKVIFKL